MSGFHPTRGERIDIGGRCLRAVLAGPDAGPLVVLESGAKLSMDGRGAWRDNVFVERLWRSVKYEHVYKFAYASVSEARTKIAGYLDWYNKGRAHSSVEDQTPDEAYWEGLPQLKEAA